MPAGEPALAGAGAAAGGGFRLTGALAGGAPGGDPPAAHALPARPAQATREWCMSPEQFLPFALPDIGEEEIAEVVDALRSGWVTTGPKAKRFEQDFAAFLGGGDLQALSVNSATAGLHLAL